jgi:hypothetical protein
MPAPLYVVYRAVPSLDAAAIAKRLGGPATVTGDAKSIQIFHAGQPMQAVAVDAPVPAAEMERCLPVAHLKPELKAELAAHKAHVALMHRSDIPGMAGLVALYQAAAALAPGGDFLGVINPITCMCLPASVLSQTLEAGFLADARDKPGATLGLWLGFTRIVKPDGGVWVVTTGAALVGLPNLAKLAANKAEADDVYDVLVSLQNYLYAGLGHGKKTILAGDTIDVGDQHLVARTPYEYVDMMGDRTLVLERRAMPAR